jgi:hypothetical protein
MAILRDHNMMTDETERWMKNLAMWYYASASAFVRIAQ